MKKILLILLYAYIIPAYAQDTTELVVSYDGSRSFMLLTARDTSLVNIYPGGRKEGVCKMSEGLANGIYTRWYENGKLMWKKEMKNGLPHGKSLYFNNKGIKVAELIYQQGQITDTVFLMANTHLVFGKITLSSKVYGGAIREDGSSNVSEFSGPYAHCRMYAALVDSIKKPEMITKFKSDFNGDFFILVPAGKISFFTQDIDIKTLAPGQYYIPGSMSGSTRSHWSEADPLVVTKEDLLLFVNLHHASEGYAP